MKRFLLVFILIMIVPISVFAADQDYSGELSSYDFSCFEKLGDDANEVLDNLGIKDFDYEKITSLDLKSFLNVIWTVIKSNIKTPLKSFAIILSFCILSAFLTGFSQSGVVFSNSSVYSSATSLVIAVLISTQCAQTISLACSTVEICSDFIFAFIPVFLVIITMSGGTLTSLSTNTLLLSLSQGLNFAAKNLFVPFINCFLALSICSGIKSELNIDGALRVAKKAIISFISLCAGGFVAILSIKTAVASRADALGLRSLRFAINSVVPVIGSAISEGLLSIQSYSSLIKSSVGIVGIIGVFAVFLPALINVIGWRISLGVSLAVSEIFEDQSVSRMLRAFSDAFLLLNVVLILTMVTTIISIGILVAAKTMA